MDMQRMTKILILEAGLLDVAPESMVYFGEGKSQFRWHQGVIQVVDKKGAPLSESAAHTASELSDYEQEMLGDGLCSYLKGFHLDLKRRVAVSLRVLEAVEGKTGGYQ